MDHRKARRHGGHGKSGARHTDPSYCQAPARSSSSDTSEGEIEFEGWVEFVTNKDTGEKVMRRNDRGFERRRSTRGDERRQSRHNRTNTDPDGANVGRSRGAKLRNARRDPQYGEGQYQYQLPGQGQGQGQGHGYGNRMVHTSPIMMCPPHATQTICQNLQPMMGHVQASHAYPSFLIQQEPQPTPQLHAPQPGLHMIHHTRGDLHNLKMPNPIYVNPVHPTIIKNQQHFPQVYIRQPPTIVISNQPRPPLVINPPPANVILKNHAPQPIYVNHARPNVIIKNEPPALNHPTNMDTVPIQLEHPNPIGAAGAPKVVVQNTVGPAAQHIHIQGDRAGGPKLMAAPPAENYNQMVFAGGPHPSQGAPHEYNNSFEVSVEQPQNVYVVNPNESQQNLQFQGGRVAEAEQPMFATHEIQQGDMQQQMQHEMQQQVQQQIQFQQQPQMQFQQQPQIQFHQQPAPVEYAQQEVVIQQPQFQEFGAPCLYDTQGTPQMQEVLLPNSTQVMYENHPVIQQIAGPQMVQQGPTPIRYTQTFTPTKLHPAPPRCAQIQQNPMTQTQMKMAPPPNYAMNNPLYQCTNPCGQNMQNMQNGQMKYSMGPPLRRNQSININGNRMSTMSPKVQISAKPMQYRAVNNRCI